MSSSLAKQISSGATGRSVAFQFTGSPVSLGVNATAYIKSAANSPTANGSNLQVSGSVVFTNAATLTSDINRAAGAGTISLIKVGAGTLTGATLNTGGTLVASGSSGAVASNTANFVLNTTASSALQFDNYNPTGGAIPQIDFGNKYVIVPVGTSASAIGVGNTLTTTAGTVNLAGLTKAGGTLILTGANTYTGATTVNAGTVTLTGGSVIPGNLTLNGGGTITFAGGNLSPAATINYQLGTNAVLGGVTLPQQAGQNVTVNGINYISTLPSGATNRLILQPVTH